MAAIFVEELGETLFAPTPGSTNKLEQWLSPAELQKKVLIRAKVGKGQGGQVNGQQGASSDCEQCVGDEVGR